MSAPPRKNGHLHLLDDEAYCPSVLLNFVAHRLGARNDTALSMELGIGCDVISRVRQRVRPIGDSMLIRIHEKTGMSTKELKKLAGMI